MKVLPRDAVLPQLGAALDMAVIQGVFDDALRAHDGRRVTACRVDRVKYRPQRNFTVAWLLDVEDARGGAVSVQRAAGRFCAAGDAAARHARHRARASPARDRGTPALFDPKLELFAWFVPDDPKLSALGRLCDAVRAPHAAIGDSAAYADTYADTYADAELIRYVPESRACARFDLGRPGTAGARRMYVKVDRDGGGGATHALMCALQQSAAQSEGRLLTPRSVLWQPATGLHWQEGIAGKPLADLYPNPNTCPPAVSARVGQLLAALHSTRAPLTRRIDAEQLGRLQADYARLFALVEPDWAAQLSLLVVELAAGLGEIGSLPQVTLHGDLHLRNILADGDRLALIDLDSCVRGAAVLDLGAWIACALDRAMNAGSALGPVQDAVATLLRAYRESAGQPPAAKRLAAKHFAAKHVAWAVAHALLCAHAYRSVANLHRGSYLRVPALIALARFILRHGVEDYPLDYALDHALPTQ